MSLQEEKVLAEGLTATQWVEMLSGDKPKKAKKAINYFDGLQEEEMTALLNDPHKGRGRWKEDGVIPRFRNVTKMIVEKSGRLFLSGLPQMNIFQIGQSEPDPTLNMLLSEEIAKVEFHEAITQMDEIVRLLKTGIMLVQYDIDEKKMVLDILHRGNCAVVINPSDKSISSLIYIVSNDGDTESYRIFTTTQVIDLMRICSPNSPPQIKVTNVEDNPWGIVPAVQFYDTQSPRSGFWMDGGYDLIALNEMVNLHLTDSEYVMSWMKKPTLFTNAKIGSNSTDEMEISNGYGTNGFPRIVGTAETLRMGPSKVVQLDTMGVDNPLVEFLAPKVDIQPMDAVVQGWVNTLARDWSVIVRSDHEARASSGFQLVIEGMDNQELRIQRQRMMTQAFKRWYRVLRVVVNKAYAKEVFPENTDMFIEFGEPDVPVDTLEQENMYDIRIAGGRSSIVAYLMETKGLSREEAVELALQYKEDNALLIAGPEASASLETIEAQEVEEGFEPVVSSNDGEDDSDDLVKMGDMTDQANSI